jgi:hypothetical protein
MSSEKLDEARKLYLGYRADGWSREDSLWMASVVANLSDEESAELWRRC